MYELKIRKHSAAVKVPISMKTRRLQKKISKRKLKSEME